MKKFFKNFSQVAVFFQKYSQKDILDVQRACKRQLGGNMSNRYED
jgi:hypothetical protein